MLHGNRSLALALDGRSCRGHPAMRPPLPRFAQTSLSYSHTLPPEQTTGTDTDSSEPVNVAASTCCLYLLPLLAASTYTSSDCIR